MYNILSLLVGSILLGIGTNWKVGLGIFIIGYGWHNTFMQTVTDLFAAITRNMKQIYDKLPDK